MILTRDEGPMKDLLPIDDVLDALVKAVRTSGCVVLQAPPGAGKTSRVPLAVLGDVVGKIVMLEPRRLAARAAAERLAQQLNEPVGQTVGYRMRGESVAGARIEVVTEGILTRMIQSDPELSGIGAVIFDEFHERSLNGDLGLALILEVREALRPDLTLIVMSATLDAGPVADLIGAQVITSQGRAYPVDVKWLDRPLVTTGRNAVRFESAAADLVAQAVAETTGGMLVFLPGEGEIRRVKGLLAERLPADCALRPLYGALPFKEQRAAIAPIAQGRKVVLATSIAETSLTIEDIRVVVDAGRARRARFDPGSGMSRLITERVTRAEATQRAGRAGRVAPGVAYKLWSKGEDGALAAFPPAEIEAADLTGLALELAVWGSETLPFLTAPPEMALREAQALLTALGALNDGRITDHGRALAKLPLHPRLGHMLVRGGKPAAGLAALLSERDILQGAPADMLLRIKALAGERGSFQLNQSALARVRQEAKRLARLAPDRPSQPPEIYAALAYPDRIAQRRNGDTPRYILSGGKGAVMDASDSLAAQPYLVVTDTDGNPREARIRAALAISLAQVRDVAQGQITLHQVCEWSRRDGRVLAREQERLGAIVLSDKLWPAATKDAVARAMLDGIRDIGLKFSAAAERFRARVDLVRTVQPDLPMMDDDTLLDSLESWLLAHLIAAPTPVQTTAQWKAFDALPALRARLTWNQLRGVDAEAPAQFTTPLGRHTPIDYSGDAPEITLRLQEMFGTTRHPVVAGRPLRVTFLSPGQKPIQTTMDVPGFWASSYADVRKDMRGQYPRHPWPEDPTQADPTLRAKQRK